MEKLRLDVLFLYYSEETCYVSDGENAGKNSLFLYYSEEAHVMLTHALFCELFDCIHVRPGVYLQKDLDFK